MMATVNFLFGNPTPAGFSVYGVAELNADITISEGHERAADVTQHPVETGATVADHVVLQPERVVLEGFVTDTPAAVVSVNNGRTQGAFDVLDQLYAAREPVDVVTGYKYYQSMVITRLDLPRARPSSMAFKIELQHVKIVATATAVLPNVASTADSGAAGSGGRQSGDTQSMTAPEQDVGRQSTPEASEQTEERAVSTLKKLTEGLH